MPLLALCLMMAGAAAAQESTKPQQSSNGKSGEPTTTLKVHVNQVLVPVVVTDKSGHSVQGLRASDFEVLENGVEQKLASFQTERERPISVDAPIQMDLSKPASEAAPPTAKQPPLRRTYVVCLDAINSSFESFAYVRGALRKVFKQEQGEDSLYAILTLGRAVGIVQNLTRDPETVLAALGSKQLNRAIQQSESANLKQQENELELMLNDYCQRCPCLGEAAATERTATGSSDICSGKLEKIESWAGAAAQERSMLTRAFLQNLRSVVDRMGQLPGKRVLVFVSDGFNARPGRDLFGTIAAYTRNPDVLMNNSISDLGPQLEEIIRSATTRDVAFYTLDSRGLSTADSGMFNASDEVQLTRTVLALPEMQQKRQMTAMETQAPLAELAASTGGVFYRNNNDLFKGMHQAFADGREYYLLAYVSSNPATDGKYREIKVTVKGKNLLVRAKHGYWAPSQ